MADAFLYYGKYPLFLQLLEWVRTMKNVSAQQISTASDMLFLT